MNTNQQITGMQDKRALLSTLWIFLTANYIYCDVLSHMQPSVLQDLMTGTLGSIHVTQEFLLAAAIMMEIPFAMIVLSRVLPYRANRRTNIIAGVVMAAIQVGTMGVGSAPTLHYLFFSAVEIATALFIAGYAWQWANPTSVVNPPITESYLTR